MVHVDTLWKSFQQHEGEIFFTVERKQFSYQMDGNGLIPCPASTGKPTKRRLSQTNFQKALDRMPITERKQIDDLQGSSYVYGLLSDKRIIPN